MDVFKSWHMFFFALHQTTEQLHQQQRYGGLNQSIADKPGPCLLEVSFLGKFSFLWDNPIQTLLNRVETIQ